MNEPARTTTNNARLQAALDDYFDRIDRNEPVDQEAFLAQHEDIAADLRLFIATEDKMRKFAARPPRDASQVSTESFSQASETLPPHSAATPDAASGSSNSAELSGKFGRYQIVRALGKGAMGMVYLAEDTQLRRQVALKTPQFTGDSQQELLERFYREARAAATLRHPGICPVFDVGDIDGRYYITMAYIDGKPLSDFVDSAAPPSEEQILATVSKIALALQEAHDHGIVHRDLKPSNIMIDGRGEPVIMDFGLARQAQQGDDVRLTQTGVILGSPAYMSPEQVEANPARIGPASDQYSLGVILYELSTGQVPFQGSLASVLGQILSKPPTPLRKLRPSLNPRIDAVCLKMLAKNPADRFASLSAVATELAAIIGNPPARPAAAPPARKRRSWWLIAPLAPLAVLAVVVLYLRIGKTTIEINVDDPHVVVVLQSSAIAVTGPAHESFTVEPGENELTITHGDLKFKTNAFRLEKGDKKVVTIKLVDSKVAATLGNNVLPVIPLSTAAKPDRAAAAKSETPPPSGALARRVPSRRTANSSGGASRLYLLEPPFGAPLAQRSQGLWSRELDVSIETTNSIGMRLKLVPPGQFVMGSHNGHFVRITHPCYFGVYEVTRGQFAQFIAATNFQTVAEAVPGGFVLDNAEQPTKWLPDRRLTWRDPGFAQEDDHPVVQIAWSDAVSFCEWLSKKEGKKYRLPTEAEWEYACRAGTMSRYNNGSDPEEVTKIANVADASALKVFPRWKDSVKTSDGYVYTSPVGHFPANNFGLYDMIGNAGEWCSDRQDADYFKHSPTDDPQGPELGAARVGRGGSFTVVGGSRYRYFGVATIRRPDWGFRVVRDIEGAADIPVPTLVRPLRSGANRP